MRDKVESVGVPLLTPAPPGVSTSLRARRRQRSTRHLAQIWPATLLTGPPALFSQTLTEDPEEPAPSVAANPEFGHVERRSWPLAET